MLKLFTHQIESINFCRSRERVFDASDPGCVSADTEFLTSTGWKRIDQYVKGDLVAQFYPNLREIELVQPLAYVRNPCDRMIAIAPTRGTSQRLSHEHRVLYYKPDGSYDVCSAVEFMEGLHKQGSSHFKRKFCSTFSVRTTSALALTNAQIRVMVAVIADGHFPSNSTRCTLRLKKHRKIHRLRQILAMANIQYREKTCGGSPDFQVFRFNAPLRNKEFGTDWWSANQAQLEIIADELPYWDSSRDRRPSKGIRFSTLIKASADFAQYAFAAAKQPASRTYNHRERLSEYVVCVQHKDKFFGPGRKNNTYEVANPEGFKYCFEVPTGFLLLRHNGYIFATGNTGKTAVAVHVFAERRLRGSGRALVISPKSSIRTTWAADIYKFTPYLKSSCAYAHNRREAFWVDADVYITNHDATKWLVKQPPDFFSKFDTLIVDELGAFKHQTSQRSKALNKIKKYFKFRHGMNGTANPNTITDIWNQIFFLDDGQRLGSSFYNFRTAVCVPRQVGPSANMLKWEDRPGANEAVAKLIEDITIRHIFEDCIDIPENYEYSVGYALTIQQFKYYKQMEKDQTALIKNAPVTAVNAATVATKLLQIASGAVYDEEGNYHLTDVERYKAVIDKAEERAHTVIFFLWKHQKDQLIIEAKNRGMSYCVIDGTVPDKQRTENIEYFQKGMYRIVFAHPQSAAHSLTLTRGTATIWASPTYNLEHYQQGLRRIYRAGQKNKTETIVFVAEDTIEEKVWAALKSKKLRMDDLLTQMAMGER